MKAKNLVHVVIGTALVLLVPLVAMQFFEEIKWDWFDFVVMGTLLFGTGLIFEPATTRVNMKYRAVIAVALAAALILIWAELAVGIFGTPLAGH